MDMADTPRTNEKVDFANAFLKKIALQAAGHLMREGGGHVYLKCGNSLDFSAAGVVNLRSSLSQIAGRNVSAFNHSWQSMVDSGTLSSQFSAASLVDFVVFISSIRRHRRKRFAQALAGHSLEVWERLRHGVVTFLAAVVRADVRQVVQSIPGIENRQVPSRKRKRTNDNVPTVDPGPLQVAVSESGAGGRKKKRKSVMADLNSIWNLQAEAQDCGISLGVLIRTKKNETGGGSSETTVNYWSRKLIAMYMERASLAFRGLRHFNVLTDASRFSTDETIVSTAYSPEFDFAVFMNNQKVKSGSKEHLYPNEFPMEAGIERLAAERKVDRVASYRLIQALSSQLKILTQNDVNMESFVVDESSYLGLVLKPMSPDVLRIVHRNGADDVNVFIRDKRSGEMKRVNALAGFEYAKFLTLQMDQGPVGMSAMSYMMSNASLIHCTWDPFHRVIRDMKLSMTKDLQQAVLTSSYVWSVNEKPFHQGGFHSDKKELLESFLESALEDRIHDLQHLTHLILVETIDAS